MGLRGYFYVWHCTCGCKAGTFFLFADEEQDKDEDYCKRMMSSHLTEIAWRDIMPVSAQGYHRPELLRKSKAVVKIVEENW